MSELVIGTPGPWVVEGCEPPCGCWEFKQGPIQK